MNSITYVATNVNTYAWPRRALNGCVNNPRRIHHDASSVDNRNYHLKGGPVCEPTCRGKMRSVIVNGQDQSVLWRAAISSSGPDLTSCPCPSQWKSFSAE